MSDCSGYTNIIEESKLSERGKDWQKFSAEDLAHIEGYTVPQYGDKGQDQCSEYGSAEHLLHVKRYLARYGKNARPGQETLDLRKCAHYLQMAAMELEKEIGVAEAVQG